MAELKYKRVRELKEMGREVIELPDQINFAGRESIQKQMGTYWHVDLCRYRLRVAEDRLKRALESKASTYEGRTFGGVEDLENEIKTRQKELAIVLSGGNPEKDTLSELIEDEEEEAKPVEAEVKTKVTDIDKEPPMSAAVMARNIKAAKSAKRKSVDD
jgi:threonine dehydratase